VGTNADATRACALQLRRIEDTAAKSALNEGERAALVAAQEALQARCESLEKELQDARSKHEAAVLGAREASEIQVRLTAELTAARESHAAVETELQVGESAVAELHTKHQAVAQSLAAERAALLAKNAALAAQMQATQTALKDLQESASSALYAAQRQNEELTARNAELAKEMDALSGEDAASLAPALAEARSNLAALQEQCEQLVAQNARLEHLAQANGGSGGDAGALHARLAEINQGFESVHMNGGPPSESGITDDTISEAGFSDMASVISEAPGMSDAARSANRARSAQNKARFEAIKQERNAFKQEAKKAAKELERMRAEVAKVEELKAQLKQLQEGLFI